MIHPSGPALADKIIQVAGLKDVKSIVEFGPGTGVFTQKIIKQKAENCFFMALELDPHFKTLIEDQYGENLVIYQDSAEHTARYLKQHKLKNCERIISGLPWTNFPEPLQKSILMAAHEALAPGGVFLTFCYLGSHKMPNGKRFKKMLLDTFPKVKVHPVVWNNIPPAFFYECQNPY